MRRIRIMGFAGGSRILLAVTGEVIGRLGIVFATVWYGEQGALTVHWFQRCGWQSFERWTGANVTTIRFR